MQCGTSEESTEKLRRTFSVLRPEVCGVTPSREAMAYSALFRRRQGLVRSGMLLESSLPAGTVQDEPWIRSGCAGEAEIIGAHLEVLGGTKYVARVQAGHDWKGRARTLNDRPGV